MKIRHLLVAFAALSIAAAAWAQLSNDRKQWGESAVQFLMTPQEKAEWAAIRTDTDADNFIKLFWARRDPTPGTPANEYRADMEARIAYADQHFTAARTKGSLSDRGKALLLFGVPTKVSLSGGVTPDNMKAPSMNDPIEAGATESRNAPTQTWTFENEVSANSFGRPRTQIVFVDRLNKGDFKMQAPEFDYSAAQMRVITAAIRRPALTLADVDKPVPPPQPVAPAAPVTPTTDLKTASYVTAVSDAKAGKGVNTNAVISVAEFVSPAGEYYAPVMLYIPKAAGVAADAADTFFLAVDDANGKRVDSFEGPVKLDSSLGDLYADRSVVVPAAGKYVITAGVGKAGAPVLVTSSTVDLAPITAEATGVSKLILSNNIAELPQAMPTKAPFAFGRLKVIPKADMAFSNKDDLNYFVEINNPGIDTATSLPKVQMGIDVLSKGQPISRLPLSEAAVGPLSGKPGPGHYALSDAIPLSKMSKPLPPGDYTFRMKILDTITKQSYVLEQNFKIVG